MAYFPKLVALVASLSICTAFAGFAQLAPPVGWAPPSGLGSQAVYRAAANEAWLVNTVRTTAALNVGGAAVEMPVAMRLAANAGRFAATGMFLNPVGLGLTAAVIAAPYALQWAKDQGYSLEGDKWWRSEKRAVVQYQGEYSSVLYLSPELAAVASVRAFYWQNPPPGTIDCTGSFGPGATNATYSCKSYHAGQSWLGTDNIGVSKVESASAPEKKPAVQFQFENEVGDAPMPWQVVNELPMPFPVDSPVLNPSPGLQPQPLRVPQGSPQAVPNSDPQQYKQPVLDVVPAPTPLSPWQVDLQPKDVTSPDPDGVKNPATPASGASGTPSDKSDLCLLHPDILACAKPVFDTPNGPDLPTKEAQISVTPDSGWGPDNASCPAPRHIFPQGRDVPIPFDLFCFYLAGIRPIVIAMAWLGAAFILIGAKGD